MCGITGFVNFPSHNQDRARSRIMAMTDAIAHRGPDDGNVHLDGVAALGHRRLSIIDLATGQQPLADATGKYRIVFNGEIYNYQELKKQLLDRGYGFNTSSDTEVLLNAYLEWGADCLARLNGMFAFAVWDPGKQELFLARDRVGKKPLYYTWDGRTFAFASEIKALLAGEFSARQVHLPSLDAYFSFGYIPAPLSMFEDIHKLPAAHCLRVTESGPEAARYWQLDYDQPADISLDEASEELEILLRDAVKCRLMSEVPLGAFLSSGIDSSLVVSFMAELTDSPVLTNTIGFGDPRFSELPGARMVADHLGTRHNEFTVRPDDHGTLLKIAAIFDEPFADSSALPTWYVCENARKTVTVALSGDGGDEAFGGYTFRYLPHMFESWVKSFLPSLLRTSLVAGLGRLYPQSARLPRVLRLKTILENLSVDDAQAFYRDLVWLRSDHREKLYAPRFLEVLKGFTPAEMVVPLYQQSPARDALSRAQHTDMQFYMVDDVLVKTDRMSMAHGLEVRNPLLDYRILEFAATLPAALKIQQQKGKVLLRHLAGKRLPQHIVNLPKQGFSIPAAQWLRTGMRDTAHESIFNSGLIRTWLNPDYLEKMWQQHQTGRMDHSVFLWGAMMLGLWEKEYC